MDVRHHVWNMLGFQIGHTSKLMQSKLQNLFKKAGHDITFEQWTVLLALWIKDGRTQQELSLETKRDETSLSRLLDNMARKNLIVRVQNPANRRTNLIYLTHKGKELEQPLIEQAEKVNQLAVKGIGEQELSTFFDVLGKIVANLK